MRGNRTVGYTASFYLLSTDRTIATFDGSAIFQITDGGAHVLYRTSFELTTSQFNVQNRTSGLPGPVSSGPGYLWKISQSQVGPVIAKGNGADVGFAYLYFASSGINASASTGGFVV